MSTLVIWWGVSVWIVLSRVIFSVLSLGIRADIAVMRNWWKRNRCDRVWFRLACMKPFKLCNCLIVSIMVGWEICVMVHWCDTGVVVMERLMNMIVRIWVVSVLVAKIETPGMPLSRGGVEWSTDWGQLREVCSCWCWVVASEVCISFHRWANVF